MNIVVLHCHFERGGVTQVVENHLRFLCACDAVNQVLLISGNRIGGLSNQTRQSVMHVGIDAMDYDSLEKPSATLDPRASSLATQIGDALASHQCTPENTVLHWHNHSLGKNVAAPAAIARLAHRGWRFLLHVHDFAEDNRPQNYSHIVRSSAADSAADVDRFLYPTADQIHYASLTKTDLSVFAKLGVPEQQMHCLPNSVTMPERELPDRETALKKVRNSLNLPEDARWCLYPVRGIRRKNVGEFLLLSRWLPTNTFAGITLRPTTPVEARSYQRWKTIAACVAPGALFDVGHQDNLSFAENVAASDYVLSPSVAEGFGMVFLEPWLMNRCVVARNLPTVTADFRDAGIEFPVLYDSIPIPGDNEWIESCHKEFDAARTAAWSSLAPSFRPGSVDSASNTASVPAHSASGQRNNDTIDFARLTPLRQTEVLQRLSDDPGFERAAREHSAALVDCLQTPADSDLVAQNSQRVRQIYSPDYQGQVLLSAYQSVLDSPESKVGDLSENHPSAMDCVSSTRPFYPCRTEEFNDA
ncbi:glycosyltransferase family 4 protein [Planctomycetes bacterium K23_9]|uniref:Glycosyl transferases group 1 n=1 Tax=Stieleria marina TaxID=1930275 RepID=A0A517P0G2_9BACT|nr:hypothetical protein K239x_48790 [Planctomycetes bacterium K23_9]